MGTAEILMTRLSTCLLVGAALGILAGAALTIAGLWIPVKAIAAQILLDDAWRQAKREQRTDIRPWRWADMTVAGRLSIRGEDFVILNGGTGQALAFAPTLVPNLPQPFSGSLRVIGAHRDTYFKSLGTLSPGERISYEDTRGRHFQYSVVGATITKPAFAMSLEDGQDTLLLVTCWPLGAVSTDSSERLVIHATQISEPVASAKAPKTVQFRSP